MRQNTWSKISVSTGTARSKRKYWPWPCLIIQPWVTFQLCVSHFMAQTQHYIFPDKQEKHVLWYIRCNCPGIFERLFFLVYQIVHFIWVYAWINVHRQIEFNTNEVCPIWMYLTLFKNIFLWRLRFGKLLLSYAKLN